MGKSRKQVGDASIHRAIARALHNYASSRIRFVMISSHINDGSLKNKDVAGSGVYRPLDMGSAPFGFPAPLAEIKDFNEGYPPPNICL